MSWVTDQRGVKKTKQGKRHSRVIVFHDRAAEMTAGDYSYVTLKGNDSRFTCAAK